MKRKSSKRKNKGVGIVTVEGTPTPLDISTQLDPQQMLFMQFYYDRESPTWGNAKQSAMAAGYGENYASQITYRKPAWWLDFVRKQDMASLIEQHFSEVMTLPTISQAMSAFGPVFKTEITQVEKKYKNGKTKIIQKKIKVPVMVPNTAIIKEKTAVAKIAAPAHNPDMYGTKRGNKNTFIFNVKQARERYSGKSNA